MNTDLFDFPLPPELIAQAPAPHRPQSRLLQYDRSTRTVTHGLFADVAGLISPGDLLVVNSSKVIPARVFTRETDGRKPAEILFVKQHAPDLFEAMIRPGRRFKVGSRHRLTDLISVTVVSMCESGHRLLRLSGANDCLEVFRQLGEMPLPPYITARTTAPERYQTVYAREEGSIAAPTAGLHFDQDLLDRLRARGVQFGEVTLHVGLGTFKPIETPEIEQHVMHFERFCITDELAARFAETRRAGRHIWACGTTSIRSLESAIKPDGTLTTGWQETNLFIQPSYRFKAVDHLITNFHLPRSTLLVLVSAFCGRETTLELYAQAVAERYRFFSFGDAMVIV